MVIIPQFLVFLQFEQLRKERKSMGRLRKSAKPQFIAALNYHMDLRGWKVEDLARNIGLSRSGLYNKINEPETFCYKELQMISKLFKVSVVFTPDGVTMEGEKIV